MRYLFASPKVGERYRDFSPTPRWPLPKAPTLLAVLSVVPILIPLVGGNVVIVQRNTRRLGESLFLA